MSSTRRAVLKGLAASVALPFLESLAPRRARGASGTGCSPPVRLAVLYMANGTNADTWTPLRTGADFELTPTLDPLGAWRREVLVLSGLWNRGAAGGDGHYAKTASFLTGTTIKKTTGRDLASGGPSFDQLAAERIGRATPLPSLELSLDPISSGIDPNVNYTQLYGSYLSWSRSTVPCAREIDPRKAFDRVFARPADVPLDQSVIDAVRGEAGAVRARLGGDDARKLDEYLDSVRAIELRLAALAAHAAEHGDLDPTRFPEALDASGRIDAHLADPQRAADFTERVELMLDVIALAFRADATRVATLMLGNAVSGRSFTFLDPAFGNHHEISHHENGAAKLAAYTKIGAWHVARFAALLARLRAIPEGEGTVLDHSIVVFGAGLRDGNSHDPHDLPILVAGRGGGTLEPGRHVAYPRDTALCRLWWSLLARVGAPVARIGDASEGLPDLGPEPEWV